jgi:hypothetical protein
MERQRHHWYHIIRPLSSINAIGKGTGEWLDPEGETKTGVWKLGELVTPFTNEQLSMKKRTLQFDLQSVSFGQNDEELQKDVESRRRRLPLQISLRTSNGTDDAPSPQTRIRHSSNRYKNVNTLMSTFYVLQQKAKPTCCI